MDALEYFKKIYGQVPDWAAKMHEFSPGSLDNYTQLRDLALRDGALSRKEKELILVGINAARRYERTMLYHTKGAVDAGATVAEIGEILLPCVLSRGLPAWLEGMKALEYARDYIRSQEAGAGGAQAAGEARSGLADVTIGDAEAVHEYFARAQGGNHHGEPALPAWAQWMEQTHPGALRSYVQLRANALADGLVSRKLKELLLVGINAAERYPAGIKIHLEAAKQLGATDQELAEVFLTALLTAGIPAWIEGSDFLPPPSQSQ